jgi:hypothetical protein
MNKSRKPREPKLLSPDYNSPQAHCYLLPESSFSYFEMAEAS